MHTTRDFNLFSHRMRSEQFCLRIRFDQHHHQHGSSSGCILPWRWCKGKSRVGHKGWFIRSCSAIHKEVTDRPWAGMSVGETSLGGGSQKDWLGQPDLDGSRCHNVIACAEMIRWEHWNSSHWFLSHSEKFQNLDGVTECYFGCSWGTLRLFTIYRDYLPPKLSFYHPSSFSECSNFLTSPLVQGRLFLLEKTSQWFHSCPQQSLEQRPLTVLPHTILNFDSQFQKLILGEGGLACCQRFTPTFPVLAKNWPIPVATAHCISGFYLFGVKN